MVSGKRNVPIIYFFPNTVPLQLLQLNSHQIFHVNMKREIQIYAFYHAQFSYIDLIQKYYSIKRSNFEKKNHENWNIIKIFVR